MKLGVFGGTFDPIHLGHLRAALEAGEALGLSKVVFVPSRIAPHKKTGGVAGKDERFAMAEAAVAGVPEFLVSRVEVDRPGASYTVDTLIEMRKEFTDAELAFLVGLDAFLEIHTWREYRSLFSLAGFAVMSRPGEGGEKALEDYVGSQLEKWFEGKMKEREFRPKNAETLPIRYVPVTGMDISSSRIREIAGRGMSVRFLVPDTVERIIREQKLYQS